jgi:hypothetical protein
VVKFIARKVILFLDNAASYNQGDQLNHARLLFLPSNTIAHIQPMNAVIIKASRLTKGNVTCVMKCAQKPAVSNYDSIIILVYLY